MADYAVTAANVALGASATPQLFKAGVAITAGQAFYVDPADNLAKLADANAASPAYKATGIAACNAAAGQYFAGVSADVEFTPGFALAAGDVVVLSATPGGLCPVADLVTGMFTLIVGIGVGSNKMKLVFQRVDTAVP